MDLAPEQIQELVRARICQIYWEKVGRFPTELEIQAMRKDGYWQGKEICARVDGAVVSQ